MSLELGGNLKAKEGSWQKVNVVLQVWMKINGVKLLPWEAEPAQVTSRMIVNAPAKQAKEAVKVADVVRVKEEI